MEKIILDCDPGLDDALALLTAWGHPGIELLAVTTVAGNLPIERVTRNARGLAALGKMAGLPIARGAAGPLVHRRGPDAARIHGEDGLGGIALPEGPESLDPRPAAQLIIDTVMSLPERTVTLVPTGPLTNIALALRLEPRLGGRVKGVTLMGGAARGGNQTPAAEFNIHADPEAAQVVFSGDWPLTMLGLDVTRQARATPDIRARIAALGNPVSEAVSRMLDFYAASCRENWGIDAPPVHDPCAVACVIDPGLFKLVKAEVKIELAGHLTRGMTVCDLRPGRSGPVSVALSLDAGRFWELILDALKRY